MHLKTVLKVLTQDDLNTFCIGLGATDHKTYLEIHRHAVQIAILGMHICMTFGYEALIYLRENGHGRLQTLHLLPKQENL